MTDRTLEELAQEFQGFELRSFPQLQRIPLSEGDSVDLEARLVQVERATHELVSVRSVPYERLRNATRVIPRATYQRLLIESLHAADRSETQPAVGCMVQNLDSREIVLTLEEVIRRGRSVESGTSDTLDILRGLGLLVNGEKISRVVVALFSKDEIPLPDFPQFNLRVARFKGATRDEFLENRQYSGNAFALMSRAGGIVEGSQP